MTTLVHLCSHCGRYTRHFLIEPSNVFHEEEIYKCVECGKRSYVNRNVSGSSKPITLVHIPQEKKDATE